MARKPKKDIFDEKKIWNPNGGPVKLTKAKKSGGGKKKRKA